DVMADVLDARVRGRDPSADGFRLVRGGVVNDQDADGDALLRQDALHAAFQHRAVVEARNDDVDAGHDDDLLPRAGLRACMPPLPCQASSLARSASAAPTREISSDTPVNATPQTASSIATRLKYENPAPTSTGLRAKKIGMCARKTMRELRATSRTTDGAGRRRVTSKTRAVTPK